MWGRTPIPEQGVTPMSLKTASKQQGSISNIAYRVSAKQNQSQIDVHVKWHFGW